MDGGCREPESPSQDVGRRQQRDTRNMAKRAAGFPADQVRGWHMGWTVGVEARNLVSCCSPRADLRPLVCIKPRSAGRAALSASVRDEDVAREHPNQCEHFSLLRVVAPTGEPGRGVNSAANLGGGQIRVTRVRGFCDGKGGTSESLREEVEARNRRPRPPVRLSCSPSMRIGIRARSSRVMPMPRRR